LDYRRFFEAHPDGILELDARGEILSINPAGLALLGAEHPAHVAGRSLHSFVSPAHHADLDKWIAGGASGPLRIEIESLRNGRHALSLDGRPLDAEAGTILAVIRSHAEHGHAQEALRQSEERYRAVINHADDGIFLFDDQGRVADVNERACERLGYSREELIGLTPLDFDTDVDIERLGKLRHLVSAGETVTFETRHRHKTGEVFPVEVRARSFQLGERIFTVAQARNIAGRRQAEEALRAREREFRTLAENLPDNLARYDRHGRALYVNPQLERTLGRSLGELVGRTPAEISASRGFDEYERTLEEVIRTGAGACLEMSGKSASGEKTWHMVLFVPERDESGEVVGAMAISREITELKRAALELEAARQFTEQVINAIPDAVFVKDREHRWILLNDATCRMIGRSREELVGRSDHEYFPKEQADAYWAGDERVFLSRSEDVSEEFLTAADGTLRYIQTKKKLIVAPNGSDLLLGAIRDITEIKETERSFRSLVNNSPDCIVRYDLEGRLLFVNPAVARTFDMPAEDFVGKLFNEIWKPGPQARHERLADLIQSAVETGEPSSAEMLWETAAGLCTFNILHVPERDETGRVVSVLGIARDITKRKRMEEALRSSREHLGSIIQSVEGIMWEADAETFRFTFVSPQAERLLGYPAEQWIEDSDFWARHLHPDDRERAVAYCVESTRQKRDHDFEYRMVAADGRVVWLRDIVSVVVEGERPVMLRGLMVDITAQKEAEQRVRRLNRTYAVLSEFNQLLVHERESRTILESACRIACEIGGFRKAWIGLLDGAEPLRLAAHAGAEVWTTEHLEQMLSTPKLQCAITTQALETGERVLCGDIARDSHSESWREIALRSGCLSMVSLPLEIEGRTVGVFNLYASEPGFFDSEEMRLLDELAQDLAFALQGCERERERQIALERLRRSEERLRELAETIEDVFWITTADKSCVLYVSPAYEKVWGRSCQSLYDSPNSWLDSLVPEDRQRVRLSAVQRQADGAYDEEYRIVRPDGEERRIRERAFPVRNASGEVERIVGVARDVTEHRELEEKYRQSQKLEAIGQLAGGVAHDFNNILLAIQMQVDLATGTTEELPDPVMESLRQITLAAERAANLTNQLLLFSRRQVMQPRELDLNESVTSLAKMLQRIIGEDVRLRLHLHSAPLGTRADPGMLDQILLNLAVNARDSMPGGGALVIETGEKILTRSEARAYSDVRPGRYVWLGVSDTGHGISPEVLPHIFEPFFTTKEAGKGTGLGLATVFGIVKQHRGWISVESGEGAGTSFHVYIPASAAAPVAQPAVIAQARPKGGGETILLVEDDTIVRRGARQILERNGYRVLDAANGVEALAVWGEHRSEVDILVTDLVMPEGLSGRQLAELLLREEPLLKVIFTSGYSAGIAGRECDLKFGENFLQKPFSLTQFLEIIRRRLDGN
jgi:PAS domain S-box-containing protein